MIAPDLVIYPPELCGSDGYPFAWHGRSARDEIDSDPLYSAIKDYIRELAGYRCERCHHPYPPGIAAEHPRGEWTPCDEQCAHGGPYRLRIDADWEVREGHAAPAGAVILYYGREIEAHWRVLTVHHLNGDKADCRWWNLAALCQRCHLTIQGRVVMERAFIFEHSEWMKPHAAGWYAFKYLGEDLTREETVARVDDLLALERLDEAGQDDNDRSTAYT